MEINKVIFDYLSAKAEQTEADKKARDAKKRADMLADEIVRYAGGRASFETSGYAVGLSEAVRVILDTDKLYRDFKDIKALDQYGKETRRTVITAVERQQEKKTA